MSHLICQEYEMEITAINYGKSYFYENWVIGNGDPSKKLNIDFKIYLVKYRDKLILIDAGCDTMPEFDMSDFRGSVKALEETGYRASDITDVIITHAHHDHIECVKYFKNACIHIQKDEYESGKNYIPDYFKVNVFDERYCICDKIKIIKIGQHSKGSCVVELHTGEKVYVMIGDECYLRRYFDKKGEKAEGRYKEFYKKYSDTKYALLFSHDN